jgi:hypothetical protein
MSGCATLIYSIFFCYIIYEFVKDSKYFSFYSLTILAILIALAVVIYSATKRYRNNRAKLEENRRKEEKQRREKEELKKHLSLVLSVIDSPSINVFEISREEATRNPEKVYIQNNFSDYIFLQDYTFHSKAEIHSLHESHELKNIILIPSNIASQLTMHHMLFSPQTVGNVVEDLKLNHMSDPHYKKGQIFLSDTYSKRDKPYKSKGLHSEWDLIRKDVLKRDDNRCVLCGETGKELHVHHIWYRTHGGPDNDRNLVTVCKDCHATLPLHDGLNIYRNGGNSTSDKKAQNRKIISHIFEANRVLIMHYLLRENPLWERKILIDDDCVKRVTLGQLLKNLGLSDND